VQFNGSLLKSNIFRNDFGDEVDAAWKSLGADCKYPNAWSVYVAGRLTLIDSAAKVPDHQAARSGIASDQVKIKDKYGGGYPAHVEGLHHLHCLVRWTGPKSRNKILILEQNLLRKSLAWNFEYYQKQGLGPFSNSGDILKFHISKKIQLLFHHSDVVADRLTQPTAWISSGSSSCAPLMLGC
jgi:hypothetical protein